MPTKSFQPHPYISWLEGCGGSHRVGIKPQPFQARRMQGGDHAISTALGFLARRRRGSGHPRPH